MKKQSVLLWGNGKVLEQNFSWIYQLYEVIGITGGDVRSAKLYKGGVWTFQEDEAVKLKYDVIMITSMYYEEINDKLVNRYQIPPSQIIFFLDEFRKKRNVSFGTKNKDITIYVWRLPYPKHKNGFMNYLEDLFVACFICEKQGYELVVDMKNYYSEYMRGRECGSVNVWEEYFKQPSKYTLEETYESKHVILNDNIDVGALEGRILDSIGGHKGISNNIYADVRTYIKVVTFLGKRYGDRFQYSETFKEKVYNEQIRVFRDKVKVLGVIARGSDYLSLHPKGHPIPCENIQYIERVKRYMIRYDYQYIYLATEDLEIYHQFENAFLSEHMLSSEQKRVAGCGKHLLMDIKLHNEDDGYIRGMEYNLVIAMLAKCDGIIANCMCGAVVGALLQNGGKYKHIEIMDNGVYV